MRNFKFLWSILLSYMLIISFTLTAKASVSQNWAQENIKSNRETAININSDFGAVVTRVWLNMDSEIAIKLRELMAGLGYSVQWNGESGAIHLKNGENDIFIYTDSDYCMKNEEKISLNNSVFIWESYSYCSGWFLENVLGVSVTDILVEDSRRIDGVSLYTPNLPDSARKPFPETDLSANGKPVYIDYAEILQESMPYNTVFTLLDGVNSGDEQIIIYSEEPLYDFKIVKLKFINHENIEFFAEETISEIPEINPPMAVLLKTYIPEGIPVEAVVFTDSQGVIHSYLLSYNGKDGGVSAIAVSLKPWE